MFKWWWQYFLISLLVSDFRKSMWSVPSISVAVLGLRNTSCNWRNIVSVNFSSIFLAEILYSLPRSRKIGIILRIDYGLWQLCKPYQFWIFHSHKAKFVKKGKNTKKFDQNLLSLKTYCAYLAGSDTVVAVAVPKIFSDL